MPVARTRAAWLLIAALAAAVAGAACAAGEDESSFRGGQDDSAAMTVAASDPAMDAATAENPTAAKTAQSSGAMTKESASQESVAPSGASETFGLQPQGRLIVRNVDMTLVVADVSEALDAVAAAARNAGGWVVSTAMTADHIATIAVRVPAEQLDATVRWLRGLATDVEAETSTSRDVTDEFVDLSARITNLKATEEQLRAIFEREGDIEDILAVQRELTRVREDIERLTGRRRFLEQTSATSLVTVTLEAEPAVIAVDAGEDRVLAEGETARFRVLFTPPEGIDEFVYEWDFGDGTPPSRGTTTAPADEAGRRTTATIVHVYRIQEDSPFFPSFAITGTGDAGIAEGEDTLRVTVTSVPNIQISAGDDLTASVGERVSFAGSFTRPAGITDLRFRWDFGDGLPPVESDAPEDDSAIEAEHEYTIDRAEPYRVTLSVTGRTEHGATVEATDTLQVLVVPASVWSRTIIDVGDTARAATRAFSATLQAALGAAIWLVIFSPVWGGLLALGFFVNRRRPHRAPPPPPPPRPSPPGDD